MSGTTNKVLGDYAPSRAPYFPVGGVRLVQSADRKKVWIMVGDESASFDVKKLETALIKFFVEGF